MDIKYDEEEFQMNVKRIAKKYNIDEEYVAEWLDEAFEQVKKEQGKRIMKKLNKKKEGYM